MAKWINRIKVAKDTIKIPSRRNNTFSTLIIYMKQWISNNYKLDIYQLKSFPIESLYEVTY